MVFKDYIKSVRMQRYAIIPDTLMIKNELISRILFDYS